MKKYVITEAQLKLVKGKLEESNLRSYVFDWDDNILYMPTTIKMDVSTSGGWEPIDVSTEDYSKVRTDSNYRLRDNDPELAFKDFRSSESFIRDIRRAVNNKRFAPSYDKFKEALIFAFLGVLKLRNEVNCLQSVTGAKQDHSSGKIYFPSID